MMTRLFLSLALGFSGAMVWAEQSTGEKASATANDAKRSVKKGMNRIKEKVCAQDDAECLAHKAKHRVDEGTDYTKDKAKELKDKVD